MKYRVKFSGEFEPGCNYIGLERDIIALLKRTFKEQNPMMHLATAPVLEVTPVVKEYKIAFRDNSLSYTVIKASDMDEAARMFNSQTFNTCVLEEIEEVK